LLTDGRASKMKTYSSLKTYDDQVYECVLNFEEDVFQIYNNNKLLCEARGNIKGREFVPYCFLYWPNDMIEIIQS